MFLENKTKYLRKILFVFTVYTILGFLYTVVVKTPLGKGYNWSCFEPGCVIVLQSTIVVYGDVNELSLTNKYIIGRVNKPNDWILENEKGYNIEGYFILNKLTRENSLAMSKDDFNKQCKKLNISNYTLKYKAPFWVVYDPYYWYVILVNKFD